MSTPRPIPRLIDFSVPEAKVLADLLAIRADLISVKELSRTYALCFEVSGTHPYVLSSLAVAAIVRYCRTFGSGVRTRLQSEWLEALSEEHRCTHRRVKDLRDKWIAHSVNSFEETQIVAAVLTLDDVTEVLQIGGQGRNILAIEPAEFRALFDLSHALKLEVEKAAMIENQVVLKAARIWPPHKLLARPDAGWDWNKEYHPEEVRRDFVDR